MRTENAICDFIVQSGFAQRNQKLFTAQSGI